MKIRLLIIFLLVSTNTFAANLRSTVKHTLKTNPNMLSALKQRLQADQQFKVQKAGFFPTFDVSAQYGPEKITSLNTGFQQRELTGKQIAATLSQNVFNGFSTLYNVRSSLALLASSAYRVNATSENIAAAVAEVYLNVLQERQLVDIAKNDVSARNKIVSMIRKRTREGLSSESELKQAIGRLASAKANMLAEINRLGDAQDVYAEIVGELPMHLTMPNITKALPITTKSAAIRLAIANNPNIKVAHYDLLSAYDLHKAAKATYYPSVNFVLSSSRGDNLNAIPGANDSDSAQIQVNYNIFRGGADAANNLSTAYQKQIAFEQLRNTERSIIRNTSTAWNAWALTKRQSEQLKIHMVNSQKVFEAFEKQYTIGKRTLFDVLNAQGEYYSAWSRYAANKYAIRIAYYRLLSNMNLLMTFLNIKQAKETDTRPSIAYPVEHVKPPRLLELPQPDEEHPLPKPKRIDY